MATTPAVAVLPGSLADCLVDCPSCAGTGGAPERRCAKCNGAGQLYLQRELERLAFVQSVSSAEVDRLTSRTMERFQRGAAERAGMAQLARRGSK